MTSILGPGTEEQPEGGQGGRNTRLGRQLLGRPGWARQQERAWCLQNRAGRGSARQVVLGQTLAQQGTTTPAQRTHPHHPGLSRERSRAGLSAARQAHAGYRATLAEGPSASASREQTHHAQVIRIVKWMG